MEKQNGTWLIVKRYARSVGRDDTKDFMTRVLGA
jgi:hypothetical protein